MSVPTNERGHPMGWTGHIGDRRKAVDIIREELVWDGKEFEVLANSGSRYWVLKKLSTGEKFAVVVITQRHNGDLHTKVMSEDMGPCYYDMPVKFLDLLSEPMNDYSREWREQVREHHAKKKAQPKLAVGDTIVIDQPIEFQGGIVANEFTYMGGYKFRTNKGFRVRLPKTWRTTYSWELKQASAA